MDVDLFQDIKIRKLIKRHGAEAVTIYTMLLCIIYKKGYYIEYDNDLLFICSEKLGMEEQAVSGILNSCVEFEIFSKEMFEQYQVLTSYDIQRRYVRANQQARRVSTLDKYSLVKTEAPAKKRMPVVKQEQLPAAQHEQQPIIRSEEQAPAVAAASAAPVSTTVVEQPAPSVIISSPPLLLNGEGKPLVPLSCDEEGRQMKADTQWKNDICVTHAFSVTDVDIYIDRFVNYCKCTKTAHVDLRDAQRHFYNWMRIERANEMKKMAKTDNNGEFRNTQKSERQGNLLRPEAEKTWSYSGTF